MSNARHPIVYAAMTAVLLMVTAGAAGADNDTPYRRWDDRIEGPPPGAQAEAQPGPYESGPDQYAPAPDPYAPPPGEYAAAPSKDAAAPDPYESGPSPYDSAPSPYDSPPGPYGAAPPPEEERTTGENAQKFVQDAGADFMRWVSEAHLFSNYRWRRWNGRRW
jgi:hypothetical protein